MTNSEFLNSITQNKPEYATLGDLIDRLKNAEKTEKLKPTAAKLEQDVLYKKMILKQTKKNLPLDNQLLAKNIMNWLEFHNETQKLKEPLYFQNLNGKINIIKEITEDLRIII